MNEFERCQSDVITSMYVVDRHRDHGLMRVREYICMYKLIYTYIYTYIHVQMRQCTPMHVINYRYMVYQWRMSVHADMLSVHHNHCYRCHVAVSYCFSMR